MIAPREAAPAREGQTFQGKSLLARYASFVKLPHTLFALPFAGVGAVLGSYVAPDRITLVNLFWIVAAFTGARFAAMGFNRIVDREYDAKNPRTQMRELPAGALTLTQAWIAVLVMAALFVFAAFQLNALCGWLSPIALSWILFYSYTKRFTSAAHWVLGLSLGIAPVGAYLALTGSWSDPWWALLLLAAAVMLWVSGFDIIYALQDIDFDRAHGLHAIPARLGVNRSLLLARVLHGGSVICFALIAFTRPFPVGWLFVLAVGFMAGLLHYEHALVRPRGEQLPDIKAIDRGFFRINIIVSMSFFVLALLDRILLQ